MWFFEESEPQEAVHEVVDAFEELVFGEGGSMIGLFEDFFPESAEFSDFKEEEALDEFAAVAFMFLEDVMLQFRQVFILAGYFPEDVLLQLRPLEIVAHSHYPQDVLLVS